MNEPLKIDWIELLTRLAGVFGFSRVRVRWKLMAWRDSWKSARYRTQATVQQVNYQHKICPRCGTVQDRGSKVCVQCGGFLAPRFLQVLWRLGIIAPPIRSVSSLLTLAIVLCFLRTVLAQGGGFMGIDAGVLAAFGGNFAPLVAEGQWWRLSTYIFLHGGFLHILFNLIALQQIGPQSEEIFGKSRMLFFFMVTGIVAGIGSDLFGAGGVSIGASGSLMGLIGMAAGWGQRDATTTGKAVRDMMIKWGVYTLVFGFMIHADNAAHAAGFICGFVLGLLSRPQWDPRRFPAMDRVMGLVGVLLALGTFVLVIFPPALPG